jgi:hypothetical protein
LRAGLAEIVRVTDEAEIHDAHDLRTLSIARKALDSAGG